MTSYARLGGRTVARFKGAEVAYLHADHLGSPVAATDETGAILWAEHFTPYGESIPGPAANPDDEGFTGHIQDTDTGLTYMQARYYDPVIGRFLSNDPVGFAQGGIQYFNRYAYTANDPVNMIDPDGRQMVGCMDGVCVMVPSGVDGTDGRQLENDRVQGPIAAAAVGSLFVPGPEDVIIGAVVATKVGQGLKTAAGAIGKLFSKGGGKVDIGSPPISVGNTPNSARTDLDAAGFPGQATPGNQSGTVHSNVPGADGPMDVRVMDGVPGSSSGDLDGPRIVTTLPGQPRAGVRPDGSRLQNPTVQEMRQACHTPLQCD